MAKITDVTKEELWDIMKKTPEQIKMEKKRKELKEYFDAAYPHIKKHVERGSGR